MKILVLNCGSSSLKYQLIDMETEEVLASGKYERIGEKEAFITHKAQGKKVEIKKPAYDHKEAIEFTLAQLTNPEYKVIDSLDEVEAIGHRVVHGGEIFKESAIIDDEAIENIKKCGEFAPLHNPAAVLGMETSKIEELILDIDDVDIANYNCPGQTVITGLKPAVEKAAKILNESGAKRVIELNVSGPFHSKFLKTAGEKMSVELEKINLTELEIPYVTNVTGEYVSDISKTKELLVKQISSPVKWEQSVRNMINNGVDTFVEIGPGKTLAGFIRKIDRNVKCINISTVDDLDKLKEISL